MSGRAAKELNDGGSSLVEDPGIPLVGAAQGRFADYSGTDNAALTSDSNHTPAANNAMSLPSQISLDVASGKAWRDNLGGSGWNLVTKAGGGRWDNISYRLSTRKKLLYQRRVVVNVSCILALLGVISMLIETELFLQLYISKSNWGSFCLKMTTTLSTLALLISILVYHIVGCQLSMVDNSIEDWRLFAHTQDFFYIFLELGVCSVHNPPLLVNGLSDPNLESVLCILMFFRLYLLGRFFVVHSRLVSDTATQSLGALNKVRIDAQFVFKAFMSDHPGKVLMVLMGVIFFISSWSLRACDTYYAMANNQTQPAHPNGYELQFLRQAMWMSAITFLTVGYGDVVPVSECGRVTAVVTGLLGVGSTALLVAVMAHKLEQSRAEKYVHSFVSRIALDKQHKTAAANIIKNVLKLWRLRKQDKNAAQPARLRAHGKLLQAVHLMRMTKAAAANIGENSVGFIELNTSLTEVSHVLGGMEEQQGHLAARAAAMENRLSGIEFKLENIAHALTTRN